jgi:hypothetical protein
MMMVTVVGWESFEKVGIFLDGIFVADRVFPPNKIPSDTRLEG